MACPQNGTGVLKGLKNTKIRNKGNDQTMQDYLKTDKTVQDTMNDHLPAFLPLEEMPFVRLSARGSPGALQSPKKKEAKQKRRERKKIVLRI